MNAPPSRTSRRLPGEEGVWVFILGDMVVFALFFGTIVYTHGQDPRVFEASRRELSQALGAINTLLLITSSLLVALGVRATREDQRERAARLLWGAVACGAGFILVKAVEYGERIHDGVSPAHNDFWMYFFVFTGLHLVHVVVGVGVLVYVIRLVRHPEPRPRDQALIESGTSYWHMVDLLWMVLFALLYLLV